MLARSIGVTLVACMVLGLGLPAAAAPLVAKAGPDRVVSPTSPVVIGGTPAATGGVPPYTYRWFPATGLSATIIANPTARPTGTTTYTLTVTDSQTPTPSQASDTVIVQWQPFVHPGILHTRADLDRMKTKVATSTSPWIEGYNVFAADSYSKSNFDVYGPWPTFGRLPNVNLSTSNDAKAAYQNAIMWYITGNQAYANKTIEILDGYSGMLTSITGADRVLAAAFAGEFFANAAEIMRYTNSGWSQASITQFEQWLLNVWYPVLKPLAEWANANWDAAATKAIMGIGIFCNNRDIFEQAVRYYVNGPGNGRLTHCFFNEDGQCQESGRDQGYAHLDLGCLSDCAQIGWSQGLDLYGHASNRLLKGFEYTAKYNLGNTVPYSQYVDRTTQYTWPIISATGRGVLMPTYEIAYNHYVNRMGLSAPYTQQAAEALRPEPCYQHIYHIPDYVGSGTLLFSLPVESPPAASAPPQFPSGVYARSTTISWAKSLNATTYTLKRGTASGGPYGTTVATGITGTTYEDTTATAGTTYYYVVTAVNSYGESLPSVERSATRGGVPSGWTDQDIGSPPAAGYTDYTDTTNKTFEMEAGGTRISSTSDNFHYTHRSVTGDCTITAAARRPLTSYRSAFGVMMRDGTANNARHASMLITGQWTTSQTWDATWRYRSSTGGFTYSTDYAIPAPYQADWGRLMLPYWLRVTRTGNTFTGYYSPDGITWTQLGSRTISMGSTIQVGLAACSGWSGSPALSTSVVLDKVSVTGWVTPPPSPAIALTGAPIVPVDTVFGTASSPPTSFTVAGSNLTGAPGNLTVTPPPGYEVSLSSGSGYSTSLRVPYSSATLAGATVYLRLAATTPEGTYAGNITVAGGGATPKTIATAPSSVTFGFVSVDDFNDNSLSSFWKINTNIPQGGASVTERNGRIELVGRGHLITAQQFDPVPCGIKITGRWTFVGSQDVLQILVRSDGLPAGDYGETANGIEFYLQQEPLGLQPLLIRSKNNSTITVTQDTTGQLTSAGAGQAFDFIIEDKGNGQLSFTLTQVGNPGNSATSTAHVTTDNFAKNFIVFHNRESGHTSYLDNVSITQSSTNVKYTSWASAMGLTVGVNDGTLDDPDFDGCNNFVEFALGGDPLNDALDVRVYVLTADSNDSGLGTELNDLILTCAVRSGGFVENGTATLMNPASGLIYTIEGSTTLDSFGTPVFPTTPAITTGLPRPGSLPAGYEYRSFYLDASNGLPGKGFLRVKVESMTPNCSGGA